MLNDLISKQILDLKLCLFIFFLGCCRLDMWLFLRPHLHWNYIRNYKTGAVLFAVLFEISINHKCIIYEQYSWNQLVLGIL